MNSIASLSQTSSRGQVAGVASPFAIQQAGEPSFAEVFDLIVVPDSSTAPPNESAEQTESQPAEDADETQTVEGNERSDNEEGEAKSDVASVEVRDQEDTDTLLRSQQFKAVASDDVSAEQADAKAEVAVDETVVDVSTQQESEGSLDLSHKPRELAETANAESIEGLQNSDPSVGEDVPVEQVVNGRSAGDQKASTTEVASETQVVKAEQSRVEEASEDTTNQEIETLPATETSDDGRRDRRRTNRPQNDLVGVNSRKLDQQADEAASQRSDLQRETPAQTRAVAVAETRGTSELPSSELPIENALPESAIGGAKAAENITAAATQTLQKVEAQSVRTGGAASNSSVDAKVEGTSALPLRTDTAKPRPESASTPAAADSGVDLNAVERARLLQRVTRAFQQLGGEGGRVRLKLHPPRLGTVGIEVGVDGAKMRARIVTETDSARSALRDAVPELRQRLVELGVQLEAIDIQTETGAGQGDGNFQEPASSRDQHSRSNSPAPVLANASEPVVQESASPSTLGDGAIDIIV